MPLPCSPVSHSASNSDDSDSDESLTTPRPGPSDPEQRSAASLSTPFSTSPASTTRGRKEFTASARRDIIGEGSGRNSGNIGRKSSVSFSPQSYPPRPMAASSYAPPAIPEDDMSMSPKEGVRRPDLHDDVAESSADERTAIIRPGRTASRAGHYGATNGEHNGYEGAAEEPRQRKNGGMVRARAGNEAARGRQANGEEHEDEHESWFKGLVEKYGSVELENKGSVARDHLALERTFLAWLRTSLSFASIGIAITQLFRLNTTIASSNPDTSVQLFSASAKLRQVGKPLGATFLGISILILLLGFHRYFESQHYVIRGKFPASRGTILIVSAVAAALIIASLVVVIAVAPQAFET